MNLIADEKILFESPDPGSISCYTPAIVEGESGRLIAAFDLGGPGTEQLKGPRSDFGDWPTGNQIRILLSDDDGASWREAQNRVPMMHEILFKAGNALYLLGHSGRLVISRSNDNGESRTATPQSVSPMSGVPQSVLHCAPKITLVFSALVFKTILVIL